MHFFQSSAFWYILFLFYSLDVAVTHRSMDFAVTLNVTLSVNSLFTTKDFFFFPSLQGTFWNVWWHLAIFIDISTLLQPEDSATGTQWVETMEDTKHPIIQRYHTLTPHEQQSIIWSQMSLCQDCSRWSCYKFIIQMLWAWKEFITLSWRPSDQIRSDQ